MLAAGIGMKSSRISQKPHICGFFTECNEKDPGCHPSRPRDKEAISVDPDLGPPTIQREQL